MERPAVKRISVATIGCILKYATSTPLLVIFNLVADPSFFAITLSQNSAGYPILSGNLINILDNASELVILAIGMTLVTSASGGQDISVGAAIALSGSVVLPSFPSGFCCTGFSSVFMYFFTSCDSFHGK